MKRFLLSLGLAASLAFPVAASAQAAAQPSSCQFVLGFKTLHDLDPADVGDCIDNQAFVSNGDAQQHTTNGLMAWRKADNWTAFTNGYKTWINGPNGLVSRLNTDKFPWEATPPAAPAAAAAAAPAGGAADISGAWKLENNGAVYSINQDQDNYIIIMTQEMRQCDASGQSIIPPSVDANKIKSPMNQVFTGQLTGSTVTGNWLVCATLNQSWVPQPITFTVSPDRKELTGQLQETLTLDRLG